MQERLQGEPRFLRDTGGPHGWACSRSSGSRKLCGGQRPRLGMQLGHEPRPTQAAVPGFCMFTPRLPNWHAHARRPPSPRTRLRGGAAGLREVLGDLNRSPRACPLWPAHRMSHGHTGTGGCWDGTWPSTVMVLVPGPHCAVLLLTKAPRGSSDNSGFMNEPMAASWGRRPGP